MAVVCEVDGCGIDALGRCVDCKRAFCLSHRAISPTTAYVDLCVGCLAAREEAEVAPRRRVAEVLDDAPARLRELGVPTQRVVWLGTQLVRRRLRRDEYIEVVEKEKAGWLLGRVTWRVDVGRHHHDPQLRDLETVLLDEPSALLGLNMVRVESGEHGLQATKGKNAHVILDDAARALEELVRRHGPAAPS